MSSPNAGRKRFSAKASNWMRALTLQSLHSDSITDRKSTRLNSSHLVISYAVFCLKKKKTRCIDTVLVPLTTSEQPSQSVFTGLALLTSPTVHHPALRHISPRTTRTSQETPPRRRH